MKTQIQQTIGTALTQDPKKVLDAIQQTATKGQLIPEPESSRRRMLASARAGTIVTVRRRW